MISSQKIIFFKQLIASAKEALFALEEASKLGDAEKFNEIKQELLKLNNEIKAELAELQKWKS